MFCAARFERAGGVAEERLREQEPRRGPDGGSIARPTHWEEAYGREPQGLEHARELILDDIRERADDQQ